jgi:hypothetical protein
MTQWTERECDVHADTVKLQGELPITPQEMHNAFKAAMVHARFHFITDEWNEFDVRDPNGVVQRVNVRRGQCDGVVELHVSGLSQLVAEQVTNGTFQLNFMGCSHLTFKLTILILVCNISQWIVLQLYLLWFLVSVDDVGWLFALNQWFRKGSLFRFFSEKQTRPYSLIKMMAYCDFGVQVRSQFAGLRVWHWPLSNFVSGHLDTGDCKRVSQTHHPGSFVQSFSEAAFEIGMMPQSETALY